MPAETCMASGHGARFGAGSGGASSDWATLTRSRPPTSLRGAYPAGSSTQRRGTKPKSRHVASSCQWRSASERSTEVRPPASHKTFSDANDEPASRNESLSARTRAPTTLSAINLATMSFQSALPPRHSTVNLCRISVRQGPLPFRLAQMRCARSSRRPISRCMRTAAGSTCRPPRPSTWHFIGAMIRSARASLRTATTPTNTPTKSNKVRRTDAPLFVWYDVSWQTAATTRHECGAPQKNRTLFLIKFEQFSARIIHNGRCFYAEFPQTTDSIPRSRIPLLWVVSVHVWGV